MFWRIIVSVIGIILILMAVGNLLLFIIGIKTTAAVTTRRYGGERQGAVNDKRYTWYVDYTFRAIDGKAYEGHMTKLGSATSVSVSKTVYYFSFAPFLNTTEDTAEPNIGQLAMIAAGVYCLVVMNNRKSRQSTAVAKNKTQRNIIPKITDYDDSIESIYNAEVPMNQFCMQCGNALSANTRFCPVCGAAVIDAQGQPVTPRYQPQQMAGWSQHYLDPKVTERAQKNIKNAWIFTLFLTVAFPIGFAVAGMLLDDMPLNEALIIGIGLGAMMFIIGLVRISRMKTDIWDGIVTDKKQKRKMNSDQDNNTISYRTIYTIFVTEDSGKKHKLNYTNCPAIYDYFNIGDKIRCHMAFGTYEKYDKSKDSSIFCNVCGKLNDMSNDLCHYCHLPLFK